MEDERTVTYMAEIIVKREGEEMRLGPRARGSSIRELAEDLVAQAAALESEAKEKLDRTETERGTVADIATAKELSGRRRRSWE
jgi:hypothetical protein